MMRKSEHQVERIFVTPHQAFSDVISYIINNKIEEIVNNANKVNTATSPSDKKEYEDS